MMELPLHDRVAAKILAERARRSAAACFVVVGDRRFTYAEVDARANRCANALATMGVGRDTRVGLLLGNRIEFLDFWFGLSRLGAVQVPIATELRAPQITQALGRSRVMLVISEADYLPELADSLASLPMKPKVVTLEANAEYSRALQRANDAPPTAASEVSGTDVGVIMNTSGTTGPAKGVMLSHAQQYLLGRNIARAMELQPGDVYYNFFPLFHNTAQAMITLPVLLAGGTMVLAPRFSASRFWEDVSEYRCTAFYYIAEILRILLTSTKCNSASRARLRVGWGIGASPRDRAEFTRRHGTVLLTGYGSTEANVPVFSTPGAPATEAAGSVLPGFEVRIADAHGVSLPPGTSGEILVRSNEPSAVMQGYDGDADATVAAWRDLWLHTGDLGLIDDAGALHFRGRIKDVIRVRGENVSAFEVERELARLDGVAEVAAIAVPGDLGGDDVKAVLVRQADSHVTADQVVQWAERFLPRFAVPRYVQFVDQLPKTPTNKVQKHVLRAMPFGAGTWDRKASDGVTPPRIPREQESNGNV